MAILSKGHTFSSGDNVTATKLNDSVDAATFASGAVDNITLQINNDPNGGGELRIMSEGVSSTQLANDAVENAKIKDNAITSNKISEIDTNFNIQSDGKVGIGTTSVSSQLTVNGDIESLTGSGPGGGQLILRADTAGSYRWNLDNEGSNSLFRIFQEDDAGGSGVERLTVDPSTGYIKIGSGVGSHALDVSGDINVSLGNTFKINGATLLLDEDNMATDSSTRGATQQSIKAYVESRVISYESSAIQWTAGLSGTNPIQNNFITSAHGLGAQPDNFSVSLRCTTTEHGYSVGDEVMVCSGGTYDRGEYVIYANSTEIGFGYNSSNTNNPFTYVHRTSHSGVQLSDSNWKLVFRAQIFA
jgi:hypothetical protein